jgi:O-antigen/teichoic acid export membrane protein
VSIVSRIGREYAAQVVILLVTLIDRLIVAAVFVRAWGAEGFALWSLAASAAGMVALFDFGLNLYYGNKLAFAVEQGRTADARQILSAGNLTMTMAMVIGAIAAFAGLILFGDRWSDMAIDPATASVALVLIIATAARTAMAVQYNLYRAHRELVRNTLILAAADLARSLMMAGLALIGAGLLAVAVASSAVMLLIAVVLVLLDTGRRYPGFGFAMAPPHRSEMKEMVSTSSGYWIQSAPVTALTHLPLFMLAASGAAGAAIATFVLVRTLANFARTGMQLFSIVLGYEAGRRTAIGDHEGVAVVYLEGSLLLGAKAAAAGGVLLAVAEPLFTLWTGRSDLFDPLLLWLGLGPVLFVPTLIMAHNYFTSVNLPWAIAAGRAAQFVLTLAFFYMAPITNDAVRMMASLALGELVGFGLPVTVAIARHVPGAGLPALLRVMAMSFLCCGASYAATHAAWSITAAPLGIRLVAAVVAGGAAGAAAVLLFGLTAARRDTLLRALRDRAASRFGSR